MLLRFPLQKEELEPHILCLLKKLPNSRVCWQREWFWTGETSWEWSTLHQCLHVFHFVNGNRGNKRTKECHAWETRGSVSDISLLSLFLFVRQLVLTHASSHTSYAMGWEGMAVKDEKRWKTVDDGLSFHGQNVHPQIQLTFSSLLEPRRAFHLVVNVREEKMSGKQVLASPSPKVLPIPERAEDGNEIPLKTKTDPRQTERRKFKTMRNAICDPEGKRRKESEWMQN